MDTKNMVMQEIKALIDKYESMLSDCADEDEKGYLIDAIENLEWVTRELREWSTKIAVLHVNEEETKRLKPLSERC